MQQAGRISPPLPSAAAGAKAAIFPRGSSICTARGRFPRAFWLWTGGMGGAPFFVRGATAGGDGLGRSSPDSQSYQLPSPWSASAVAGGGEASVSHEDGSEPFAEFLQGQLLHILNDPAGPVRQAVMLTDGTDTRPLRLLWPSPLLLFDISPNTEHGATTKRQIGGGVKIPRSCLLQHIPLDVLQREWESEDLVEKLLRKGYRGDSPSVWAIKMPTELSEESLQRLVAVASYLLMKGSTFIGVLPFSSTGASEEETRAWLRKLFVGQGFRLDLVSCQELARIPYRGPDLRADQAMRVFAFTAQQQRLSDAQLEVGRMQMEMAEEVDEDGFEDSW